MGCCHSHSHSGEKKRDTPPSASSLPLELDVCSRKPHPYPQLRGTGTSRHCPPFPPVVAAGSTDSSKSPPFLEEEAVKEVIPESANRRSSPLPSSLAPHAAAWFPPQPPDLPTPPSNLYSQVDRFVKINVGDGEETSEIYSASESFSTSTIPEKDDDWGDHKMLERDRDRDPRAEQSPMPMSNNSATWTSPSKLQRRSRGGGKCTNSSTSPHGGGGDDSAAYSCSPNSSSSSRRLEEEGGTRRRARRPLRGGSRAGGGRQMGVISRNVPAAPGPEDRRIRSRSPAMRSGHNTSSMGLGRTPQNADAGEDKNQGGGEGDSLDNPIVSLECFIFL